MLCGSLGLAYQFYLNEWWETLIWQVELENRENFGDRNQLEILKVKHLRKNAPV